MILAHFRKRISWYLIGVSGLLSTIGYILYYSRNGIAFDFSDLAYSVIQLFLLESNLNITPVNLPLNIARFLAPASLATAVIQGFLTLFSTKIKQGRIKSFRGHIVIFGDSPNNLSLAQNTGNEGKEYVLAQPGLPIAGAEAETEGLFITKLNHLNTEALADTGFYHCRYFIISCIEDGRSLSYANELLHSIDLQRVIKPIDFIIVFNNPEWTEYSYDLGITGQVSAELLSHQYIKFRYLNYKDTAIRRVMLNHAPDVYRPVKSLNDPGCSVCVIGFNEIAERMMVNLALNSHYINGLKLQLHLFTDSQDGFDDFASKYQLSNMLDFSFHKYQEIMQFSEPVSAIYLAGLDETRLLSVFSAILRNQTLLNRPKIIISDTPQSAGSLLVNEHTSFIDLRAEATVFSTIIDESIDELARIIHNDYLKKLPRIDPLRPTHRPWDNLPDEIRNRSRQQADHLWIKLRSLNVKTTAIESTEKEFEIIKDERLEALSKAEHDRWCAYMFYKGWKPGETRDDALKIHTDLIPYEDLSEEIKQYDRNVILNMPLLLKELGYKIVENPLA